MYAKNIDSVMPAKDQPVGFDFEKGDWVAPYGNGINTDMALTYSEQQATDSSWRRYGFQVAFPNTGGGAYIRKKDTFSTYHSDHEANDTGEYVPSFTFVYERTDDKVTQDIKVDTGTYLVFRTRTVTDSNGKILEAHYGKIYGPLNFARGPEKRVSFTYYFNPTPNDRNIEFDPKQNLSKPTDRNDHSVGVAKP